MPGIVGLVTKMPRERAECELSAMVAALSRDPSYGTGTWIDEGQGMYVGWSYRRNSFSEGMPLRDGSRNVTLIFSGEEYRDRSRYCLKEELEIGTRRASEYLLQLYEEDASFPANLNGRFQGLLVDRARGTAKLFNDRYGMHRVYFHESNDAFYFAVEAKTILAVRPELRVIDQRGLGEFIACGCVLENRTLFQKIYALPPASCWVLGHGALQQKANYFEAASWENQEVLGQEDYYQQLRDVFSQTLPHYFNGHEKIGMSLTGGLDTRMIMAWRRFALGSLPCYSFGGMYRDCQDVRMARKVAGLCGQTHEVIPVDKKFLSKFADYAERTVYLTDGCAEVNRAADLYVNERAREIAPVRMTGNYGGEVLRRIVAFKPGEPLPNLLSEELAPYLLQAANTYRRLLDCHPLSFAIFRQAPWHHYGLLALEETQLSLRSPYLDNEFIKTVYRAPASALDNKVCLHLIADGSAALSNLRTDRGLAGSRGPVASAILRNYLEFTFKADYGMPQPVARVDHILSPLHLERLFLGRHKFCHYRVWYRDYLADYVREMLLDSRSLSRPYVNRRTVETIVNGHLGGGKNYTSEIHKLLTLELVHRIFVDSN